MNSIIKLLTIVYGITTAHAVSNTTGGPCLAELPCCETYPCDPNPAKTTIEVGFLFNLQRSSGWVICSRLAVETSLDIVNQDPSILPNHEIVMRYGDTGFDKTEAMFKVLEFGSINGTTRTTNTAQRKLKLVLGPVTSNEATSAGLLAGGLNLPMVTNAMASDLDNKDLYPTHTRTVVTARDSGMMVADIVSEVGWTQVAVLARSDTLGSSFATGFSERARQLNVTVLTLVLWDQDSDPDPTVQLDIIKATGARVIVAMVWEAPTTFRYFEAAGMLSPKYTWIGDLSLVNVKNTELENRDEVISRGVGMIDITQFVDWESPRTIALEQAIDRKYELGKTLDLDSSCLGSWTIQLHDSARLAAAAFHQLVQDGVDPTLATGSQVYEALTSVSIDGATGEVSLDANGNRKGSMVLEQLRQVDGEWQIVPVGIINSNREAGRKLQWHSENDVIFRSGTTDIPKDKVVPVTVFITVDKSLYFMMTAFATLGICVVALLLAFNIRNSNLKFMKMSTPQLNNVTLIGTAVTFSSVFCSYRNTIPVPNPSLYSWQCNIEIVMLMYGFTLTFGSLFIKIWRVHKIFNYKKMRQLVIPVSMLLGQVVILLAIDTVLIALWLTLSPMQLSQVFVRSYPNPDNIDEEIWEHAMLCSGDHVSAFTATAMVWKGGLLLVGAVLVFETRSVSIPAMNDSHSAGLGIYTTLLVCALVIPTLRFIDLSTPDAGFILHSGGILFNGFAIIALLFAHKVRVVLFHPDQGSSLTSVPEISGNKHASQRSSQWQSSNTGVRPLPSTKGMVREIQEEIGQQGNSVNCI